jgi:hypothetical protein
LANEEVEFREARYSATMCSGTVGHDASVGPGATAGATGVTAGIAAQKERRERATKEKEICMLN